MNQDLEHLRLLSIFHYVVAGLGALISCIPLHSLDHWSVHTLLRPETLAPGLHGVRGGSPGARFLRADFHDCR